MGCEILPQRINCEGWENKLGWKEETRGAGRGQDQRWLSGDGRGSSWSRGTVVPCVDHAELRGGSSFFLSSALLHFASSVKLLQRSAGSPPAPEGHREGCFPPAGFSTLLRCEQRGQIGHFTPPCTTKAAQLGAQVCRNDLASTSSILSAGLCLSHVPSGMLEGRNQRNDTFPEVSCGRTLMEKSTNFTYYCTVTWG